MKPDLANLKKKSGLGLDLRLLFRKLVTQSTKLKIINNKFLYHISFCPLEASWCIILERLWIRSKPDPASSFSFFKELKFPIFCVTSLLSSDSTKSR
ncbi:hypothetical protein BpHYR1_031770 [Brachionus plicatilis]|uniref:Uncharacterized protein n=1 Tax=Brachionus plicatilis TaxID=10195 RepID=A0A3M7PM13_BRAPC|nr:hypothetical protein BpHYR1_031770 [Brachionus plicatilis]